jgi:PAS domain S-box-containing protein
MICGIISTETGGCERINLGRFSPRYGFYKDSDMTTTVESTNVDEFGSGSVTEQDVKTARLKNIAPYISRQPDWLEKLLRKVEKALPAGFKPKSGYLYSFKNRILISTLVVVIGGVIIVGVILQLTIFPRLHSESPSAILNLIKIIHFVVSIVIIAASCIFIQMLSKNITLPLLELTKCADQISREAGENLASSGELVEGDQEEDTDYYSNECLPADEVCQLTSSFNRMLIHLKASESSLRESEEKYRFLFDNAPSPIFVLDASDLAILDVNARAEEDYQYSRKELLKMTFSDLDRERDLQQTRRLLSQITPTETNLLPVLHHTRRDGSLFVVNFQGRFSRYRNRPAIIAAVWDVTEKLEQHAMLIQAGKMATLGEMATGIAHELNQPLNVIKLGCDYVVKKIKTGQVLSYEDLVNLTKELTFSVDRASKIINHLRQFGRKADESMGPVDPNTPIRNVFTLMGSQLEARGIRWELELDYRLPQILGDANRLEQVFINLLLNARDAMLTEEKSKPSQEVPTDKVVKIVSRLLGNRIVVTVSDTGPGIPEAIKNKIFEPFFTTKKTGEGTGLGLSISYGIIREHHGTIEIDSGQKHGATFRLTFPVLKTESDDGTNFSC